jgi:copper chaperone
MTRTYSFLGMTCEHCTRSVHEEVSEITGVSRVDIELASGRLTVTGEQVSDQAVAAAVAGAGYELAG